MDRRRRRPLCVCDSTLEPISRGESAQVARRRLRFHAFFLLGSRLLVSACHLVSFSLSLFLFLSLSPSIPLLHSDSISLHRMSSFVYFKFSLSLLVRGVSWSLLAQSDRQTRHSSSSSDPNSNVYSKPQSRESEIQAL